MLKNLKKETKNKKEGKTAKDDSKKTKQPKDEEETAEIDEDEACSNLVDINYEEKGQKKVKTVKNKQNYTLQEKDIESTVVLPEIKREEKKLSSWVPASQQAALDFKNQFKLEQHLGDFQSITDQKLNQQTKKIIAQQPPKQQVKQTQQGMKTAKIEKTEQQLRMERADNDGVYVKKKPQNDIPFAKTDLAPTNLTFTNSKQNEDIAFKPMEKSIQQLKMEELERKEHEKTQTQPKKDVWISANKQKTEPVPTNIIIRDTPLTFTNSQQVSSNNEGGIKFAKLEEIKPKGGRRVDMDDDNTVYVSKKEIEERKKKRQQRQREAQQPIAEKKQ